MAERRPYMPLTMSHSVWNALHLSHHSFTSWRREERKGGRERGREGRREGEGEGEGGKERRGEGGKRGS